MVDRRQLEQMGGEEIDFALQDRHDGWQLCSKINRCRRDASFSQNAARKARRSKDLAGRWRGIPVHPLPLSRRTIFGTLRAWPKKRIWARSDAMKREHLGTELDDFLREEHLLEVAEATAAKRVIAFQIEQEMKRRSLTKSEMASRMKTSRPALERLLDPANPSVTLSTLERAASALGKKLKVELA
jgi:hypothetical protein